MINKYIKNSNSTNYFKNFEDKVINIDWQKINYNRIAFINKAVTKFNDCKYLEIGCETNICFNSIITKNKKGVDPNSGGTIKAKSDDFLIIMKTFMTLFLLMAYMSMINVEKI